MQQLPPSCELISSHSILLSTELTKLARHITDDLFPTTSLLFCPTFLAAMKHSRNTRSASKPFHPLTQDDHSNKLTASTNEPDINTSPGFASITSSEPSVDSVHKDKPDLPFLDSPPLAPGQALCNSTEMPSTTLLPTSTDLRVSHGITETVTRSDLSHPTSFLFASKLNPLAPSFTPNSPSFAQANESTLGPPVPSPSSLQTAFVATGKSFVVSSIPRKINSVPLSTFESDPWVKLPTLPAKSDPSTCAPLDDIANSIFLPVTAKHHVVDSKHSDLLDTDSETDIPVGPTRRSSRARKPSLKCKDAIKQTTPPVPRACTAKPPLAKVPGPVPPSLLKPNLKDKVSPEPGLPIKPAVLDNFTTPERPSLPQPHCLGRPHPYIEYDPAREAMPQFCRPETPIPGTGYYFKQEYGGRYAPTYNPHNRSKAIHFLFPPADTDMPLCTFRASDKGPIPQRFLVNQHGVHLFNQGDELDPGFPEHFTKNWVTGPPDPPFHSNWFCASWAITYNPPLKNAGINDYSPDEVSWFYADEHSLKNVRDTEEAKRAYYIENPPAPLPEVCTNPLFLLPPIASPDPVRIPTSSKGRLYLQNQLGVHVFKEQLLDPTSLVPAAVYNRYTLFDQNISKLLKGFVCDDYCFFSEPPDPECTLMDHMSLESTRIFETPHWYRPHLNATTGREKQRHHPVHYFAGHGTPNPDTREHIHDMPQNNPSAYELFELGQIHEVIRAQRACITFQPVTFKWAHLTDPNHPKRAVRQSALDPASHQAFKKHRSACMNAPVLQTTQNPDQHNPPPLAEAAEQRLFHIELS
jgi:hypothetical protein